LTILPEAPVEASEELSVEALAVDSAGGIPRRIPASLFPFAGI